MNKQQLQQDIETMKQRLASMEAELNKKPVSKVFIPTNGDIFCYLDSVGDVCISTYTSVFKAHVYFASIGNCYRTRKEAEKARDKQLAYVRVTRKLRELEGDWVADWSDGSQRKYRLIYDCPDKEFYIYLSYLSIVTDKYMHSTKEACRWVIDNMADDLKLIFEVELCKN